MDFYEYLKEFEVKVIIQGILLGHFGKIEKISTKQTRLALFEKYLGSEIYTEVVMAVDYYGYYKKSSSLIDISRDLGSQHKMLDAIIIHFASVRMDQIAKLAAHLIEGFPHFKNELLYLRGFNYDKELKRRHVLANSPNR